MSFAHLVDAIDGVLRRLGGTSRAWRTDRMATVVVSGTDRLTAPFAQVAKHYGVEVWVCPPRRPQRKGVVEAAVKYLTRSWWRTAPVASLGPAQADLDRWALAVSDRRKRRGATIAELAAHEALPVLPAAAFPAQLEAERVVSRTAMVALEGNRYSVAPGHIGQPVTVRARLGELHLEIISPAGRRIARHRRAPAGAGQLLQSPEHARLLERALLDAFTTDRPCRRKANRPPGTAALAETARLRGHNPDGIVVDLEDYARIAKVARSTSTPATSSSAATSPTSSSPPRPSSSRPRSSAPSATSPATPSFCTTCSTSRSPRPSSAASPAACGSPGSHPPRPWRSSTSAPNPRSIGASSTSSPPCASSTRRPTSCSSGRPAPARQCSRSRSASRPSTPATASATPPPPTSSPAPPRPPTTDAGRPPCASATAPSFSWLTSLGTCRCPAKRQPPLPGHQPPYEHGSIILTTNRGIANWSEIFEDTTVAAAILDRLLHHATVLQINSDSYRMRGHRARLAQLRAGLNQPGEFS